jgi:hypothetical protein
MKKWWTNGDKYGCLMLFEPWKYGEDDLENQWPAFQEFRTSPITIYIHIYIIFLDYVYIMYVYIMYVYIMYVYIMYVYIMYVYIYKCIYIVIGEVLNSWNAGHWVSRSSSPN